MGFWKREKKKKELEEVKKAVSPKPMEVSKIGLEELPERPKFAPLFVKIDRYQEVLKTIEKIKSILLRIRELLNVIQQIDKLKLETNELLQKNIQELLKNVASLDKEFVRPKGIELERTFPEFGVERINSYVDELQRELNNLKVQLQEIK